MKFQQLAIAVALSATSVSTSAVSPWGVTRSICSIGRSFGIPSRHPCHSPAAITSSSSTSSNSGLLSVPRGGADSATVADAAATTETLSAGGGGGDERSLEEKVRDAMKKYGLDPDAPPAAGEGAADDDDGDAAGAEMNTDNCEGGVCEIPQQQQDEVKVEAAEKIMEPQTEEDINAMADRITAELDVDRQIVLAALGATATGEGEQRRVDETLARELILAERDAIRGVTEDCDEVKQLVSEGHDALLSRRALAFTDMNVDDARAILVADEEDEELDKQREEEARAAYEEEQARLKLREEMEAKQVAEANMKEIKVDAGFDPTQPAGGAGMDAAAAAGLGLGGAAGADNAAAAAAKPPGMPGPAKKEDVVFDITTDQIQDIIMESPVPVLLDARCLCRLVRSL